MTTLTPCGPFCDRRHNEHDAHNTNGRPDYEAQALAELRSADYFRGELAAALNAGEEDRDLVLIASYKAGITYALNTAQAYATLAALDAQRGEIVARIEALEESRTVEVLTLAGERLVVEVTP